MGMISENSGRLLGSVCQQRSISSASLGCVPFGMGGLRPCTAQDSVSVVRLIRQKACFSRLLCSVLRQVSIVLHCTVLHCTVVHHKPKCTVL